MTNDNSFVNWPKIRPKKVQNYHIQILFLAETNSTVLFRVGFIPIIVLEQEKQKFTINTLKSIRSLLYFFLCNPTGQPINCN